MLLRNNELNTVATPITLQSPQNVSSFGFVNHLFFPRAKKSKSLTSLECCKTKKIFHFPCVVNQAATRSTHTRSHAVMRKNSAPLLPASAELPVPPKLALTTATICKDALESAAPRHTSFGDTRFDFSMVEVTPVPNISGKTFKIHKTQN